MPMPHFNEHTLEMTIRELLECVISYKKAISLMKYLYQKC